MELCEQTLVLEVLWDHVSYRLLQLSLQPHGWAINATAQSPLDIGASPRNSWLCAAFRWNSLWPLLWQQLNPQVVQPTLQALRRQRPSAHFLQAEGFEECDVGVHSQDCLESLKDRADELKQGLHLPLLQSLHVPSRLWRNAPGEAQRV